MPTSLRRVATAIVVELAFAACGSATTSAPITVSPSVGPSPSTAAPATASPTSAPAPSMSHPMSAGSAAFPVRRVARDVGLDVLMAPGPGGTLFVSIPSRDGTVLTLLDRSGRPRPGWPIAVTDSPSCGQLLPLDDGSVRAVCDAVEPPSGPADVRAFAFDAGGRSMAGWPVNLGPIIRMGFPSRHPGRVVGDELILFAERFEPETIAWVTTIGPRGSVRRGTVVPEECCAGWAVAPDRVAYGSGWEGGSSSRSQITALDLDGGRPGWPVAIDGSASAPGFGPGGRVVVTSGSASKGASRVHAFNGAGAVLASSAMLPIATVESGVDCVASSPMPPIVGGNGTIIVFSEIDSAVFALDPSLHVMTGWPYRPATLLARPNPWVGVEGISCASLAVPALGPDGNLYLALQARRATVGGNLVAVGPNGRVRPGWPVELRQPGAEFWSVVVGPDGTAYALAIEPESGGRSSATILAIAPDSTVRHRTTIIEP